MFKIISAFSVAGFLVNTVMSIFQSLCGEFASSIGFGLLAVWFFVIMVLSGYLGLKR
jgi:hypothetical protein